MEQDVSLVELFQALIKGKKIIVLILLACLIPVVLYNFIITKPIYEAKAVLKLNRVETGLEDIRLMYPDYARERLVGVKDTSSIKKALELANADADKFLPLVDKIKVINPKETAMLEIYVTDNDPKQAASVANQFAEKFMESYKIQQKEEFSKTVPIKSGENIDNAELDEDLKDLRARLEKYPRIIGPQGEIEDNVALLNYLRERLLEYDIQINGLKATIAPGEREAAGSNKQRLYELEGNKLRAERLLSVVLTRIEELHEELIQKTISTSVSFELPAKEPVSPVGPNKVQNVAKAAILGFLLGVFVVLLRMNIVRSRVNKEVA